MIGIEPNSASASVRRWLPVAAAALLLVIPGLARADGETDRDSKPVDASRTSVEQVPDPLAAATNATSAGLFEAEPGSPPGNPLWSIPKLADMCSAPRSGPQAREEMSRWPIVKPSAPGPWRRELKFEEPQRHVPGQNAGRVISPRGPSDFDFDGGGRWLPGYQPVTPEAQAEYERWHKQREYTSTPHSGARSAPGRPGRVDPGSFLDREADDDEPIDYIAREEEYPVYRLELKNLPEEEPETEPRGKGRGADYHNSGLTNDEYIQLKELAESGPETPDGQNLDESSTRSSRAPGSFGVAFDAISSPFQAAPPDPIMAVGPNHLVAIVNSRYRVWNKSGVPLTQEITLPAFFSTVPDCSDPFDVFIDYDEANDRFVMGAMNLNSDGTSYLCVAATTGNDPTGGWNRFSFSADVNAPGTALDYPHMGIGLDAVYIAGNMFANGGGFDHIRAYALDKTDLYNGDPLSVAEANLGAAFFTGQPAKLHGFTSGGWPDPGTPHHIVAHNLNGVTRIWHWINPITQGPTIYGDVGEIFNGAPPNAPELDGGNLQDTDNGRYFDAEFRDDKVWTTRAVNCNFGGGSTEACIDWLLFDVRGASPTLLDQQTGGAYGSTNEFRYHPDISVDRNNNIAIGYTKSSTATYTEVWVTGREFTDPAGELQSETLQRAGLGNYTDGVGCGGTCDRWGDYTGMTVDPDGCTFWYLGQFSDGGNFAWDTHIGSYKYTSCSIDSSITLNKGTFSCDDSLSVTVTDSTPIDADTVSAQTTITTSGDSETILAGDWSGSDCAGATCTTWTATIPVSGTAGSNNDGTVNVIDADTINVTYTDPHPGHQSQTRSAGVSCQTRFDDGGFLVDGGCENGTGTELYRDYLDAGEYVSYTFGVFNPPSAQPLTDVSVTLAISGPAAADVTVHNPTINLGPVAQGQLASAIFQISVDPAVDSPAFRLSDHDFNFSVTSAADGFTVPQVITQQQLLQADDNIVTEAECWNFEADAQGFVNEAYVLDYFCEGADGCVPPRTVFTVAAPWTRGSGCGSETRTDYPDMTCDIGGTNAFKLNPTPSSCNNFPQGTTAIVDDVLYTPIFSPVHTDNAANGQPWNFQWLFAEWFYRSDNEVTPGGDVAAAWAHFWSYDYTGVVNPAVNEIDSLYQIFLGFFFTSNQDWDSATPYDPENPPANLSGASFPDEASGLATAGLQWRWGFEVFDGDLGGDPLATAATPGMSIDNMSLTYDQYHAMEQIGVCSDAAGTVAFDRSSYQDCPGGGLNLSVLDGDASSPVTVTVSASGSGDTETLTIGGPGPYFATVLPYSTASGASANDGTLFVTPFDTVTVSYDDDNPIATVTADTIILCDGGDVVVDGVVGLEDNGDNDDYGDTNESVDLSIRIRNNGAQTLTNVRAMISTSDSTVECISKELASFGTIAGGGGTAANDLNFDPFTFKVANSVQCTDPNMPPTASFTVLILADEIDGSNSVQRLNLTLDLNDLPGTVTITEDFDTQPVGFFHTLGPGDDDGVSLDPNDIPCSPYVDEFFWRASGGNPGGGYFCWQNPTDNFPNGTYSDLNDSAVYSPVYKIGASSTTLSFDHEYQFASNSTLRLDGARVDFSVNGGAWQKLESLPYDGGLITNFYCNPLCNGGWNKPCFTENSGGGENIFGMLNSGIQNWTTAVGQLTGLAAGDQVQFRWRVGSMNSSEYGFSTPGGYGLDNLSVTSVVQQACDTAINPDVGCGVVFGGASNLTQICGDDDLVVEPTEVWQVDADLKNVGSSDAVNVMADLSVNASSAVAATITGNPGDYGTLSATGGTGTATYQFTVDAGAMCVSDLTFDMTNISDSSGALPPLPNAFAVQIGAFAGMETSTQQVDPISAQSSTASSTLTPSFTLATPVDTAVISYGFSYSNSTPSEQAVQDQDPINATNVTTTTTLSPGFTITSGTATVASVNWTSLSYAGNLNRCTRVFLRTPNATDVELKAFDAAPPALPVNVLSTYQGGNGGLGQYSIGLEERSGGGCNDPASLSGATMDVTGSLTTGEWTNNVQVSLFDGSTAQVLKAFGVADANPYDVTAIYNGAGPGSYEIRIEDNGGGTAALDTAIMDIASIECDLGCGCVGPQDPQNLTAELDSADVVLSFVGSGATDATYNIYRDFNRDPSTWGAPIATGVTDQDAVAPGIQYRDVGAGGDVNSYYYKVTESTPCGGESPL